MKFYGLSKWELTQDLDGLVFFAQRMNELLFDFTLDSYKPSALNASFLCAEALSLISDIEEKIIESGSLTHVLDELKWSIQNDKIAKSLLELDLNYYILDPDNSPLDDVRQRLEVLGKSLGPRRYFEACKDHLHKALLSQSKRDIDFLSRTICTSLMNIGYSKAFLYNRVKTFFFHENDGKKITKLDQIEDFFSELDTKIHHFEALFLVDSLIKEVSDSVKAFNIEISDEIPTEYEETAKLKGLLPEEGEDYEYVLIKQVRAFDRHSARSLAERKIDNLSDVFSLFHHEKQISWKREALVSQKCCTELVHLVQPTTGPMQKGFDFKPQKASKALNKLISTLSLRDNSFQKFNRAADLHGISIGNDVVENQLVNLWTAIETLVPSHVSKSKIKAIVNFLMPFLTIRYIHRILERYTSDLYSWDRKISKRVLNKVPNTSGKSLALKALYLLAIDKNQDLRDELYKSFKDFHLLRFRTFNLCRILSSSEGIRNHLLTHETKVSWQLRRIYRTRNLIVHSGRTPRYTGSLIENGHDYLDQLMEGIMSISCGPFNAESLEQVFNISDMWNIKFKKQLKELDSINEHSISFLIRQKPF
ncbi:hypothetical protein [Lacimicrobium alkaliphilum]|uniref:Apea-like HEPN domain-containing protein n=1 Tax=Lacimicrobium alkaliphilum TaxID=1526571 RepID=A0A0U2Z523_9ALTE|nr:hypothetical protein [Lacimicrobium alkaliphilum]ALS97556.1 hypothetical protein AT746_04240 [Lacimicrobium alkaliphilum]